MGIYVSVLDRANDYSVELGRAHQFFDLINTPKNKEDILEEIREQEEGLSRATTDLTAWGVYAPKDAEDCIRVQEEISECIGMIADASERIARLHLLSYLLEGDNMELVVE